MYQKEGIRSFYRGLLPSLFMSVYGVIQMYSYEILCHQFKFDTGQAKKISWDNMAIPFLIGGLSRSIASATLHPINIVRMRLQMKTYSADEFKEKKLHSTNKLDQVRYNGMLDCIKKMYKNEGALSFYKGITPGILKIFPSSGIFFLFYEFTLGTLNTVEWKFKQTNSNKFWEEEKFK